MKKIIYYLVVVSLLIGCGAGGTGDENSKGIIVPAYFSDNYLWEKIKDVNLSENPSDFLVIVNPDNGPGEYYDEKYADIVNSLKEKTPLGYVYTKWGERDIDEVKNDIDRWIAFYPGVKGFFLDEASADESGLAYYSELFKYIKSKGAYTVVLNPGTRPQSGYYGVSDVVVVFEGDVKELNPDVCKDNFSSSAVIVYGAGESEMKEYKSVCGYVYFTDDGGNNPYDTLPWYFDEEIEQLK
jgi:hypothetical protein